MGDISKEINSKFANNRIKALLNILYTANWISGFQNEFFKSYGISPQQFLTSSSRLCGDICLSTSLAGI